MSPLHKIHNCTWYLSVKYTLLWLVCMLQTNWPMFSWLWGVGYCWFWFKIQDSRVLSVCTYTQHKCMYSRLPAFCAPVPGVANLPPRINSNLIPVSHLAQRRGRGGGACPYYLLIMCRGRGFFFTVPLRMRRHPFPFLPRTRKFCNFAFK